MKKLLVVFLCLITLCLFVACKNENSKDPTQEKPQGPGEIGTHFCDYQDILDTISLLHSQGDEFDASRYADLDERESAIYNSLPHFICGGSGYCIKDINNDGIDELIMLTEMWSLKGLFTLKDGLPVLIEKCDNGGIGEDGKIRAEFTEETDEYNKTVYQLKSLVDGSLVTEVDFEEIDVIDSDKANEYYQVVNGERVKTNHFDYIDLILTYSFRDYHNLTPSADITCTRLLDIPTLLEKGEYYSLSMLEGPEYSRIYFLEVYGKDGKTVLSCEGQYVYAYELKVSDQETIVRIRYDDGRKNYYNVLEDDFSEDFYGENILAEHGRTIVCLNKETDEKRLVVRDIFDPNRFYRSYDYDAVNNGIPYAQFSQDGKSITLQYRVEGAKNDTTRVLCLEELPILKTQKICYVRYAPSISSDIVMVSSGVRAVLRADTNDTIRLLSDGIIEGGEYESHDGIIRNDWYCIDYKGEICYVTADSFEMSHQLDTPIDDKPPRSFISKQERASWKDKIVTVLSKDELYEDYKGLEHY